MEMFAKWLAERLSERDMSHSDLARASGIGRSTISEILSERREVGRTVATAIAKGLKLPPEQVFRAAGLLPPSRNIDGEIEEILHKVQDLSKADRDMVLEFIGMLDRLRVKKK
jgi:transcriptional regulator with XRE-family HTH domain